MSLSDTQPRLENATNIECNSLRVSNRIFSHMVLCIPVRARLCSIDLWWHEVATNAVLWLLLPEYKWLSFYVVINIKYSISALMLSEIGHTIQWRFYFDHMREIMKIIRALNSAGLDLNCGIRLLRSWPDACCLWRHVLQRSRLLARQNQLSFFKRSLCQCSRYSWGLVGCIQAGEWIRYTVHDN